MNFVDASKSGKNLLDADIDNQQGSNLPGAGVNNQQS